MKENENIVSYFMCIDDVINTLRGLRETILEEEIVQKVLRSFPMRFDSKVSVLKIKRILTQ